MRQIPFMQLINRHLNNKPYQTYIPIEKHPVFRFAPREATVAETVISGKIGRVHFRASDWPARCLQNVTILPGRKVRVVGIDNITLIVECQ
ncbi:MAG: NfeD family protein [Spirulinaceae cyanobacterium]